MWNLLKINYSLKYNVITLKFESESNCTKIYHYISINLLHTAYVCIVTVLLVLVISRYKCDIRVIAQD